MPAILLNIFFPGQTDTESLCNGNIFLIISGWSGILSGIPFMVFVFFCRRSFTVKNPRFLPDLGNFNFTPQQLMLGLYNHLLLILAEVRGRPVDSRPAIDRDITHEHIANMVGSTRQWVTTTLARFQRDGLIAIDRDRIFIDDPAGLRSVG